MKKIFFALIVALFSLNVNAQRQKLYIPKMDKKLIKSDKVRDWMSKNCPGKYFYSECYDTINKRQYVLKDSILTITESFTKKSEDSHVFHYKLTYQYYPNNQLKFVTITMNTPGMYGNLFLGNWYYYRENGKVFQKINNENIYKHKYFDLIAKAKEMGIENPVISRYMSKKGVVWRITSITKGNPINIERTVIVNDKNLAILFDKISTDKNYNEKYEYSGDETYHQQYDYFYGRKKL